MEEYTFDNISDDPKLDCMSLVCGETCNRLMSGSCSEWDSVESYKREKTKYNGEELQENSLSEFDAKPCEFKEGDEIVITYYYQDKDNPISGRCTKINLKK